MNIEVAEKRAGLMSEFATPVMSRVLLAHLSMLLVKEDRTILIDRLYIIRWTQAVGTKV
jgi:hypothetical protein